jgi:hypothetical protein
VFPIGLVPNRRDVDPSPLSHLESAQLRDPFQTESIANAHRVLRNVHRHIKVSYEFVARHPAGES